MRQPHFLRLGRAVAKPSREIMPCSFLRCAACRRGVRSLRIQITTTPRQHQPRNPHGCLFYGLVVLFFRISKREKGGCIRRARLSAVRTEVVGKNTTMPRNKHWCGLPPRREHHKSPGKALSGVVNPTRISTSPNAGDGALDPLPVQMRVARVCPDWLPRAGLSWEIMRFLPVQLPVQISAHFLA